MISATDFLTGDLLTAPPARGKLCFMVLSVGIDMVEVERIQKALEDSRIGKRFRERVLRPMRFNTAKKNGADAMRAMPDVLPPKRP